MGFFIGDAFIPLVYVHLGTLAILVCTVVYADHEGFLWVRGKKQTLSPRKLVILHALVWMLLGIMIFTGVSMAWPIKDYLFTNTAFLMKMLFVLALLINSFFIGNLLNVAALRPFASLTKKERLPLFISGGVSTISWIGAIVSALFMF